MRPIGRALVTLLSSGALVSPLVAAQTPPSDPQRAPAIPAPVQSPPAMPPISPGSRPAPAATPPAPRSDFTAPQVPTPPSPALPGAAPSALPRVAPPPATMPTAPQAALPGPASGAAPLATSAPSRGISLRRCLELAEHNHPNIWAARARLKTMVAQLDEARFAPFSEFTATGGFGIAPTVRGNNIYSPNTEVSLSNSMGVFWRVGLEGVIPLWMGNIVPHGRSLGSVNCQSRVSCSR